MLGLGQEADVRDWELTIAASTEVVQYLLDQEGILAVVPMLGWYMTK